jgi:glycosyltransferase involved in cell wall biosynthesis
VNLLLINHYAGSPLHGMEYRPHLMARAWQRQGHLVRVVTGSYSHLRSRQPVVEEPFQREVVEGVEFCWLRTPAYQGNGVGRVRNMAAFVSGLYRHEARITEGFRPDVVISSSTYPLDAVPARAIARRHGAQLVHELHDLWPLSPMLLGGMSRFHPFIAVMQWGEDYAYRNADRVVSMLPCTEPHMREHGLAPGKWAYVPNGIDIEEWEASREPLPLEAVERIEGLRARFPFLVGYAGAHGVANALGTVPEIAAQVAEAGVGLVLVGQGPEKAALQAQVKERGLANVLFLPVLARRAVPAFLGKMDGLYLAFARHRLYRYGVSPNKLFDYLMAGRPVVYAIQEDVGNDLVTEARCGLSVPPDEPAAIAGAVRKLAALGAAERTELGERGRQFVQEHHSYDVLSRRFLEALEG